MMNNRIVGVLGAGVIGSSLAQSLAQTGHRVILIDISDEVLARAKEQIRNSIRLQGLFHKQGAADPEETLHRIAFTLDYERLKDADVLVENVVEKWEVKRAVYARADRICPEHCFFASNTSCIPITRIASATERPSKVIGMHFMNPVPMKDTVEVIRGYHTSDQTLEQAKAFLKGMGKTFVIVADSPGFASNRVLMLTINEAIFLVQDQVASAKDVDHLFKACFGHKMGPLETADLIGLDTILHSMEVLYESFNDGKYRPCPLLKKMVDAGLHGRKSGQGFYSYQVP